jgi:hypothetical protein
MGALGASILTLTAIPGGRKEPDWAMLESSGSLVPAFDSEAAGEFA